jgi:hypothetical protein
MSKGLGLAKTYFIRCKATGQIKIGWAVNPRQRLATLQTGSPGELELVAVLDGGRETETQMHQKFKHLQERGEWFRCEGDLAKFLGGLPPLPAKDARPREVLGGPHEWTGSGVLYIDGGRGRAYAERQGCVIAETPTGLLVEFYSWVTGGPTYAHIVPWGELEFRRDDRSYWAVFDSLESAVEYGHAAGLFDVPKAAS